jgi:hypothetical protein
VDFRDWFGPALSEATLQGLALRRPRGYDGDFEIIDRIYRQDVSQDERLTNWDRFYQRQEAPRAVRDRKTYFHGLLDRHWERCRPLHVLKLANGPGRCLFEWFERHPEASVFVDCVEADAAAIAHAEELNRPFSDRLVFTRAEPGWFQPRRSYDLIWIPGLFDSFNDGLAATLLIRLLPALEPGGELVVGGLSGCRASRSYMELLGESPLYPRNGKRLRALALACGIPEERIGVCEETGGGNAFLHLAAESARILPGAVGGDHDSRPRERGA